MSKADRILRWDDIENAPVGQRVLVYSERSGQWGVGIVRAGPHKGSYEVDSDVFDATHYATVEGPSLTITEEPSNG